jgi:branched-chain amino acid transport system substrate-binding protein
MRVLKRTMATMATLALVATGCGGDAFEEGSGDPGAGTGSPADGAPDGVATGGATAADGNCQLDEGAVRIGVQGSMSGAHADYGAQTEMGATLAMEEINQAGGVLGCSVELQTADSELDAEVAIGNARRFVNEFGAKFVVGVDSSGVALALAPVVEELDAILVATHAGTEKLTEQVVFQEGNEHVFRTSVPVYQDAIAAALVFKDMPEITRIATIGADYEYGRTAWQMFKDTLSQHRDDVEFVAEAWAPFLTSDFNSQISSVMAKDPDLIFSTPWAGEAVTLIRQAHGAGVFDSIDVWWQAMGGSVDVLEAVTPQVDSDAFQGKLWATGRYLFNHPDTETNQEFVQTFRERFDRMPNYSAATTYTAVHLIRAAVEEAGSLETDAIVSAMEGLALPSPLSDDFRIRAEDHQGVYSVPVGRVAYDAELGMACVCADLTVFEPEEYYREPPFDG